MVSNPCSILNFEVKILIITLFFAFLSSLFAQKGPPRNMTEKEEYLFSGTGFFIKNRKPYNDYDAKKWFEDAFFYQKKGDNGKALSLYEKFSKRRSDAVVVIDSKKIKVGPESLLRAAKIREKKGDWSKSFSHLKLIAKAYTDYDFEVIADYLLNISEKLAREKLPKKWGVIPRFRSGTQDRLRFNEIVEIARGPKYAPRALMILAEISIKDNKEEEAIDALERLINLYPDHFLSEKAYFQLAQIYEGLVSGPNYDQGATLKALNFYEDYLILYKLPPAKDRHESSEDYLARIESFKSRKELAEKGRSKMRSTLSKSKLEVGKYVENYGKYFITRWRELGDLPATQFYNEAITIAPESEAAREAEKLIQNSQN